MTSINLNPKIWGPHAWFFIDSIALSLPPHLDNNLQQQLKNFFISFSLLLPCESCKNHFSDYMKKTNLINYDFSTKDNVIFWINNLHNIIRISNNSNQFSINSMYQFYINKYSNYYNYYNYNYYIFIILLLISIIFFIFYFNLF
jgi:hypothetical protein